MATKRINSRAKGCRGERAWRDQLIAMGFDARRGQQFSGGKDSPDVVCDFLSGVHCEVKCVAGLDFGTALLADALDQARADATISDLGPLGTLTRPYYVAWKPDRKPWRITYPCGKTGLLVTVFGPDMKKALLMLAGKEGA